MIETLFHIKWGFQVEKKGETPPLFEQVHGNRILSLPSPPPAPGTPLPQADGAYSLAPQFELYVFTADCFPVLLFTEEAQGPVVALHAGWKGLKSRIVKNGLSLFKNLSQVHAIVGPAIGSCCFSVREDFISEWSQANLHPEHYLLHRQGRTYFDLLSFLMKSELQGVPSNQIHVNHFRCTACSLPSLPSFRRNKVANPRLRTWIRKDY